MAPSLPTGGPWPFEVSDKKPNKAWAGLGWNPIQTGDCYLNPSKVVEHRNDGREIYIQCIPMQWPLNNVPGDCIFETWTTLEGPVIHMRYRCTNQRSDKTAYRPCPQELPAVYTISKLWRLMSYIDGGGGPSCPCMGSVFAEIGIAPATANRILWACVMFMILGSICQLRGTMWSMWREHMIGVRGQADGP